MVDGFGPGAALFKVLELGIDLLHWRVISGGGATVVLVVVMLDEEFVDVEEFDVEFESVVLFELVEVELSLVVLLLELVESDDVVVVVLPPDVVVLFEADESELVDVVLESLDVDVSVLLELELVSLAVVLSVEEAVSLSLLKSPNLLLPPESLEVELEEVDVEVSELLPTPVPFVGNDNVGKSTPVMTSFLVTSS